MIQCRFEVPGRLSDTAQDTDLFTRRRLLRSTQVTLSPSQSGIFKAEDNCFAKQIKYKQNATKINHNIQIATDIEVNSEFLFPEVAGILPKCRRHAGNIPAMEGNKTHY